MRIIGSKEVREVTSEEAEQILENTYSDAVGGMAVNASTGKTIYRMEPDVDEIIIVEQMLGGG